MSKKSYPSLIKDIALANVFSDVADFEYLKRKHCREYSKLFSTPLREVESYPFYEVLLNILETEFEKMLESENGYDDLAYLAQRVADPHMDKNIEDDLQVFLKKRAEIDAKKELLKQPAKTTENKEAEKAPPETDGLEGLEALEDLEFFDPKIGTTAPGSGA